MAKPEVQTVNIHLTNQIIQNGEMNQFQVKTQGQFVQLGPIIYLRYQEDASALARVTIKLSSQQEVMIKRQPQGEASTKLIFDQRQPRRFAYQTPYGSFWLRSQTQQMQLFLAQDPLNGQLKLQYQLFNELKLIGSYKLRLLFEQ